MLRSRPAPDRAHRKADPPSNKEQDENCDAEAPPGPDPLASRLRISRDPDHSHHRNGQKRWHSRPPSRIDQADLSAMRTVVPQ